MAKLTPFNNYSIVSDHLGTPILMYDKEGKEVWHRELTIYGEVKELRGWRVACPFMYPGQYEDLEIGIHYNFFRYYDPDMGQYIFKDPIGLKGGFGLYNYVNNPNHQIDPFGLFGFGDINKLGNFNKIPNIGDGMDGHELLQSKWLREHGYGNLASSIGSKNPAIAVDPDTHARINADQRAAGLYDTGTIRNQTAMQNIDANASILEPHLEEKYTNRGMSKRKAKRKANKKVKILKKKAKSFCHKNNIIYAMINKINPKILPKKLVFTLKEKENHIKSWLFGVIPTNAFNSEPYKKLLTYHKDISFYMTLDKQDISNHPDQKSISIFVDYKSSLPKWFLIEHEENKDIACSEGCVIISLKNFDDEFQEGYGIAIGTQDSKIGGWPGYFRIAQIEEKKGKVENSNQDYIFQLNEEDILFPDKISENIRDVLAGGMIFIHAKILSSGVVNFKNYFIDHQI